MLDLETDVVVRDRRSISGLWIQPQTEHAPTQQCVALDPFTVYKRKGIFMPWEIDAEYIKDWVAGLDDGTYDSVVAAFRLLAEPGQGSVDRWWIRSPALDIRG